MAFLDNLKTLQQISDRCDVDTDKLKNACTAISAALDNSNNILGDNAAAIATIESDVGIDGTSGDAARQALAAITQSALVSAQTKVAATISRLQAAKTATQNL